jgi:NAD+ kinase
MAAGGPILPPELQNFLVLPVAPHLTLDRAIVLHQSAQVRIIISTDHEANMTSDGQETVGLQNGDEVEIERAPYDCLFARVRSSGYFYRRLMAGLGLASAE